MGSDKINMLQQGVSKQSASDFHMATALCFVTSRVLWQVYDRFICEGCTPLPELWI